jgi:hypothetical protein
MITKKLKSITFEYNEISREFNVVTDYEAFTLSKIQAFALLRFIVRIAQRNWLRRKKD